MRPQVRIVRHDESQRPHDVGRRCQQHLALLQRLANQGEMKTFEVSQPAVDQLGAGGRRMRREIVLLAQKNLETATCGITRNACAVDATADDEHIELLRRMREGFLHQGHLATGDQCVQRSRYGIAR